VYIVYLTAWVDPEGRVQFRDDIYGHDAALREATEDDRMGAQKQDACERLQRLAAGLGAR
jgi:murein L,D-transpeptidase YcbB/YkuD